MGKESTVGSRRLNESSLNGLKGLLGLDTVGRRKVKGGRVAPLAEPCWASGLLEIWLLDVYAAILLE